MTVAEILDPERVTVASETLGLVRTKEEALAHLAGLLARAPGAPPQHTIERALVDRERLQSTGVGSGVAMPHGTVEGLGSQIGAALIGPEPIDFDAIDGEPVTILFAVVAPKRATGEHLKTLARISRLLRDDGFRARLLAAPTGQSAYELIAAEEGRGAT